MDTTAFNAYFLKGGHTQVAGWVAPGALTAMQILMQAQDQIGVSGHIGEIGVHHGRYFLAMAALSRSSEKLVAVDIFEDQHLNIDKSGQGDREQFLANIAVHGPADAESRLLLIKADSTDIQPEQLRDAAGDSFRFFSVDGGHTVRHVINDLALAEATLAEGGVISVDDFFNSDWPGIAEGLLRYVMESATTLVPLFYGDNKLYLVQKSWVEDYWLMVERELDARAVHVKRTEFLGHPVAHIRFRPPEPQRVSQKFERAMLWNGKNSEQSSYPAVRFDSGWSPLERAGRWTMGNMAHASILAPELRQAKPARLHLHCYAFTGAELTRAVSISANGDASVEVMMRGEAAIVTLELPAEITQPIELLIAHQPAGSPHDIGWGVDNRELGILLTAIELESDPED